MQRERYATFFLLLYLAVPSCLQAVPSQSEGLWERVSCGEYIEILEHWEQVVISFAESNRDGVAQIQKTLPSGWLVVCRDTFARIPSRWLSHRLAGLEELEEDWEERRDALVGIVRLHLEEARVHEQSQLREEEHIQSDARDRLEDILSRPQFQAVREPGFLERLWYRFTTWVSEILDQLTERTGRVPLLGPFLQWVLAGLLVLLFLWILVRNLKARSSAYGQFKFPVPPSLPKTSGDWLREARAAAREGEYRDAVFCGYWAVLSRGFEQDLWKRDETLTHREYLRLLSPETPLSASMRTITNCFEKTWYGGVPATEKDFELVRGVVEELGELSV